MVATLVKKILPVALPTLILHFAWKWPPLTLQASSVEMPKSILPSPGHFAGQDIQQRSTYWKSALLLVAIAGATLAEVLRLLILSVRVWLKRRSDADRHDSPLPTYQSLTDEEDRPFLSDWASAGLHVGYQFSCASLVAVAFLSNNILQLHGLDYEYWVLWLLAVMVEQGIQVIIRSLTSPTSQLSEAWPRLAAPKILMSVCPGVSDRPDIMLDWCFVAICLQRREPLSILFGLISTLIIIVAYTVIYMNPGLRTELRIEHFAVMEPPDEDEVQLLMAVRDAFQGEVRTVYEYFIQQAVNMCKPLRQEAARKEDLPQAIVKFLFIIISGGGFGEVNAFVKFTLMISTAKAILIPLAWRHCLQGSGTLHNLLKKLGDSGAVHVESTVRDSAWHSLESLHAGSHSEGDFQRKLEASMLRLSAAEREHTARAAMFLPFKWSGHVAKLSSSKACASGESRDATTGAASRLDAALKYILCGMDLCSSSQSDSEFDARPLSLALLRGLAAVAKEVATEETGLSTWNVQVRAASAVGNLVAAGRVPMDVGLPLLRQLLAEKREDVRLAACMALQAVVTGRAKIQDRSSQESIIRLLARLTKDPAPRVRAAATTALASMACKFRWHLHLCLQHLDSEPLLSDRAPIVKTAALKAIIDVTVHEIAEAGGVKGLETIETYCNMGGDVEALACLGPNGALCQVLARLGQQVAEAWWLSTYLKSGHPVWTKLITMLHQHARSKNRQVRAEAAKAFGHLSELPLVFLSSGSDCEAELHEVIEELKVLVKDNSQLVRLAVADGLCSLATRLSVNYIPEGSWRRSVLRSMQPLLEKLLLDNAAVVSAAAAEAKALSSWSLEEQTPLDALTSWKSLVHLLEGVAKTSDVLDLVIGTFENNEDAKADAHWRAAAAMAVGNVAVHGEALEQLAPFAHDDDDLVRDCAAESFIRLTAGGAQIALLDKDLLSPLCTDAAGQLLKGPALHRAGCLYGAFLHRRGLRNDNIEAQEVEQGGEKVFKAVCRLMPEVGMDILRTTMQEKVSSDIASTEAATMSASVLLDAVVKASVDRQRSLEGNFDNSATSLREALGDFLVPILQHGWLKQSTRSTQQSLLKRVGSLGELGPLRGHVQVLESLLAIMCKDLVQQLDSEGNTRWFMTDTGREASKAFCKVVEIGQVDALKILEPRMIKWLGQDLRKAVFDVFLHVAEKGQAEALDILIPMLMDKQWDVCELSCSAVGRVAEKGDERALTALIPAVKSLLKEKDWKARCQGCIASQAIVELSEKGREEVLELLAPLLTDRSFQVRQEACSAIGLAADTEDQQALELLKPLLAVGVSDDLGGDKVREAAGNAVREIAAKGGKAWKQNTLQLLKAGL